MAKRAKMVPMTREEIDKKPAPQRVGINPPTTDPITAAA
jgi:hypothetical protein